eukprot:g2522.t1
MGCANPEKAAKKIYNEKIDSKVKDYFERKAEKQHNGDKVASGAAFMTVNVISGLNPAVGLATSLTLRILRFFGSEAKEKLEIDIAKDVVNTLGGILEGIYPSSRHVSSSSGHRLSVSENMNIIKWKISKATIGIPEMRNIPQKRDEWMSLVTLLTSLVSCDSLVSSTTEAVGIFASIKEVGDSSLESLIQMMDLFNDMESAHNLIEEVQHTSEMVTEESCMAWFQSALASQKMYFLHISINTLLHGFLLQNVLKEIGVDHGYLTETTTKLMRESFCTKDRGAPGAMGVDTAGAFNADVDEEEKKVISDLFEKDVRTKWERLLEDEDFKDAYEALTKHADKKFKEALRRIVGDERENGASEYAPGNEEYTLRGLK